VQSETLQEVASRNQKWGPSGKTQPGFGAASQIYVQAGDEVVDMI